MSDLPARPISLSDRMAAGMQIDPHELIRDGDRDTLLRLAVGDAWRVTEHRFRNVKTGETSDHLNARIHRREDWVPEERTVITSDWRATT